MSTVTFSAAAATTSTSTQVPTPTPSYSPQFLEQYAGHYPVVIISLFMILCPVFIGLRFLSRSLHHAPWGWDDWMCMPALFTLMTSYAVDMALVLDAGVGWHLAYWQLTDPDVIIKWDKLAFAVELTYIIAICFTKMVLACLYLRVLGTKRDKIITWITVGITIAGCLAQVLACCMQCFPFAYQWDKAIAGGHCFNQQAFYEWLSISNLVTDIVMLGLPIPTVIMLRIDLSQKFGLVAVFLAGSFGFVFSIVRFVTYFRVHISEDPTYNSSVLICWTVLEPGMYIISACLPVMRPLLKRAIILASGSGGGGGTGGDEESGGAPKPSKPSKPSKRSDPYGDKMPLKPLPVKDRAMVTIGGSRMKQVCQNPYYRQVEAVVARARNDSFPGHMMSVESFEALSPRRSEETMSPQPGHAASRLSSLKGPYS